jgi:hypothetical protein
MEANLTSIAPIIAWPWRLRELGPEGRVKGGNCIVCRRDVAVTDLTCRPICIYCGMDRGIVPLEDRPIR